MATKPTDTFTFATDALFTSGPASGLPVRVTPPTPAQGFVPGDAIAAEYVNHLQNIAGQWITDWLAQGSSSPGLDAHLVETDAVGLAALAAAQLGGTASTSPALAVTDNAGATPAVTIDHLTGAPALAITAAGPGPAVTVAAASGFGLQAVSGDSAALVGFGGGVLMGVAGIGGAGGGAGVVGFGQGAGDGGAMLAGPTGAGVTAQAGAVGGPAVVAGYTGAPAAPLRGRIFVQPTLLPAAPVDGDLWKITGASGAGRGGLEFQDLDGAPGGGGPGKQRVWSTENGLGYEYAASEGQSDENATVVTPKVTLTLGFSASPGHPPGKYMVEWQCRVHIPAGFPVGTRAEITFSHPGGLEIYEQSFSTTNERVGISGFIEYALPPAGTATFQILFRTLNAGDTIRIENARIVARGAYE